MRVPCRPFAAVLLGMLAMTDTAPAADPTERAQAFIAAHERKIRPLEVAASEAWWNANVSGKDEDFKRKEQTQNRIDEALGDKAQFAELKGLEEARAAKKIADPSIAREVRVLYLQYLEKQVSPELLKKITARANAVEQKFNVFRAEVAGEKLSDSEVRKVLKNVVESPRRQAVWEASKKVGAEVAGDLKELVLLRNQMAKELGFKNYHALMLMLNEQDGDELIKLFDDLDTLTRAPFLKAKAEIDAKLAKPATASRPGELQAWHYTDPFFQESPAVFAANLDAPFAKADILKLCKEFYAGIGLPIDAVLARSDLYEKPGKSPHAFCTDIDREGDVRVLANIVPNEYWMGTMLHELGHSVYSSKNIPKTVPYVLRGESHILTTEGVAMQFERFSKSRPVARKDGREGGQGRRPSTRRPREGAAESTADLLALVPGDAALREGDVREPRAGSEQAVVGSGREVPGAEAAPRAATPRTTPARSTSSARRSTTTTT